VTFLIDRGGLVGNDGETHHGQFDLSYLNNVPNLTVMAPKDSRELVDMLRLSKDIDSPLAIRYPRGSEYFFDTNDYNIYNDNALYEYKEIILEDIGVPELIYRSDYTGDKKLLIIAIGNMVVPVIEAVDFYYTNTDDRKMEVTVLNARYLKPLRDEIYASYIEDADVVMTFEDNSIVGGFGSNIERIVNEHNLDVEVIVKGIPDRFITHGNTEELMDMLNLTSDKIREIIEKL